MDCDAPGLGVLELPQKRVKRKSVTRTSRAGNVTVAHDVLQRDVVPVRKSQTKVNQGIHLLFAWLDRTFFPSWVIFAAEITDQRDSQV